jgi:hypothetical protein
VFFQNADDRDAFVSAGVVRAEQANLVPGPGVDLARFAPPDRPPLGRNLLLAGRLFCEMGVVGEASVYSPPSSAVERKTPFANRPWEHYIEC